MRMFPHSLSALLALAATCPVHAQDVAVLGTLEGGQVVPPTASAGVGTIGVVVDPIANTLTYELAFHSISGVETFAGIYGYASTGNTGALVHALPLGFQKSGIWSYAEIDEPAILAGLAYLRIDSSAFPGGDVRAQLVVSTADAVLFGPMDADQVIPPSGFTGSIGMTVLRVDTASNTVAYEVTMATPNIPIVTYIRGYVPAGQTSSFLTTISPVFHVTGVWVYPEEDEAQLLNGLTYVTVHTFKGLEIRGQMNAVTGPGATFERFCPAGVSATGCQAVIFGSGTPSASQAFGFDLRAASVPGMRNGIFFFGASGRQQSAWGNGTSFQCVVPPVFRAGLISGHGTVGACDGFFDQDLNARWCAGCPKPGQNPGAGAVLQAQLWYRDPNNTSNQTTSLSDAIEFTVGL